MPQFSHDTPTAQVGKVSTSMPARFGSVPNPRSPQIITIDVDSTTTDGTYVATLKDDAGATLATASYVAVSKTAAQIAAGWSAAILADPAFRGFISSAPVAATDQVPVTFLLSLRTYTIELSGPSGPDILATQAPGYNSVSLGVILQASSGTYTTTYSDASLALGVTCRDSSITTSYDPTASDNTNFDANQDISVLLSGEIDVAVKSGITVALGEKVYFNPTTKTWSNVTTDSHVLVEGAQWRTAGTGVQRVFVNLPSET